MTNRDKAILVGLFLSKYNKKALKEFGFKSFQEAFNILGYALETKPSSIKNYRDEFDPFFPNNRKGWHKRETREYCLKIYRDFNNVAFSVFVDIIKSIFFENYKIEKLIDSKELSFQNQNYFSNISVAKRLLTGKSAEEYFKTFYKTIDVFNLFEIEDTTNLACGFDYLLTKNNLFYFIEVKGLYENKGNIQFTEKEFLVAKKSTFNYGLFIVSNFKEKPKHDLILNPVNSELIFKKSEKKIIQINYNTRYDKV